MKHYRIKALLFKAKERFESSHPDLISLIGNSNWRIEIIGAFSFPVLLFPRNARGLSSKLVVYESDDWIFRKVLIDKMLQPDIILSIASCG